MKILLLGKNGQIGWELQRTMTPLGIVTALDYKELNLEDFDDVRETIRAIRPQIILNASAYTAVDKAENEPEKAFAINATVPGILAQEARSLSAALIHFSTDYVFDGAKTTPYTEKDIPNPLNVYGQSKLAGEHAIEVTGGANLVFRTAWVYSTRRDNFVTKVLQWSRNNEALRIVEDQISSPTWARYLAEVIAVLVARAEGDAYNYFMKKSGIYHLAGKGGVSRFYLAQEILRLDPCKDEQLATIIQSAHTSEFPTPAMRPLFTALNCTHFETALNLEIPPWDESLRLALDDGVPRI